MTALKSKINSRVSQIQATANAFSAILADGLVVTWGDPDFGGDSSEVQDQLKGVQQIQATANAFSAILADGLVVTWGDPDYGGDSSEVSRINSRVSSRFKQLTTHLLRS